MAIYNSTNPAYEKYLEELSAWNEAMQTAEGEATSSESELKSATTQPEKPKKQPKYIAERVTLDVKTMYTGANALNADDIKQAHALFRAMDTHDEASKERATNIYNLESLTYEVQEIIYDEVFIKVTTQGERDELESKARQASEWIEKDGDSASVQDIQARYDELMVVLDGLNYRKTQFERREEVAEALDMHLVTTRKLVDSYRVDYTGEELEPVKGALGDLEEALSEAEAWFEKKKAEQTALALTDDPVLTTEDMEARDKQVQRLLARVLTKKVKKIQVTTTDPAAEGGNSERSSQDSRQEKGDAEDNANGGADSETRGESEGRDGNAAEYAHDEL
ncbi:lumenal Hsp70 protein [Spiromyces aspiralis]|uniref:Lumenal Hsp70 protein n=1 Tax=Spiromyces aspiralis TaxID=68401 RepID=A0ACC1HHD1_9FUNG|nr:lumenal Hsp70 protein [Spiromyces aspiralis]